MPLFTYNNQKVFFIHIPKCGGSSVEKSLESATGDISLFTPDPGVLPCTPQHLDRKYLLSLFPPKYTSPVFFTIVRHPVLRLVSEFFHETRTINHDVDINTWAINKISQYQNNPYMNLL